MLSWKEKGMANTKRHVSDQIRQSTANSSHLHTHTTRPSLSSLPSCNAQLAVMQQQAEKRAQQQGRAWRVASLAMTCGYTCNVMLIANQYDTNLFPAVLRQGNSQERSARGPSGARRPVLPVMR